MPCILICQSYSLSDLRYFNCASTPINHPLKKLLSIRMYNEQLFHNTSTIHLVNFDYRTIPNTRDLRDDILYTPVNNISYNLTP